MYTQKGKSNRGTCSITLRPIVSPEYVCKEWKPLGIMDGTNGNGYQPLSGPKGKNPPKPEEHDFNKPIPGSYGESIADFAKRLDDLETELRNCYPMLTKIYDIVRNR